MADSRTAPGNICMHCLHILLPGRFALFTEWKLRIYSELREMRLAYIAALFIALAFFIAGALFGARTGGAMGDRFLSVAIKSEGTVFAVYLSLVWRRTAALTIQCALSIYAASLPAAIACQLVYELLFSMLWGSLYTDFWRGAALTPFLIVPAAVYMLAGARITAHTFDNAARQIKLRHIPRTAAEIVFSSRKMAKAYFSSWLILLLTAAVESVVAHFAL